MLTGKSPRKVMCYAYHLAVHSLPAYSHKFSRHDFTLGQLFACLIVKEQLKCSYRGAEAVLRDCPEWRRMINMTKTPDAGYDSEANQRLARCDLGLVSLIPPLHGRPCTRPGARLSGRWRRRTQRMLKTKRSRRRCGYTQRQQVETVMSMIKRNLGSALRGKSAWSRKRDMTLKCLTHDLMILRRQTSVETEPSRRLRIHHSANAATRQY
jgi:hypothetical protein